MKVSQLFVQTLREAPSDAVLPSHALLMRGGYIKPLSTGIFGLHPLGFRVIRKIEQVIREEMESVDGQEVLLPLVQAADLWRESGRYDAIGEELLRFRDRNQHEMVLAMTHEEAVTDMARSVLSSWRQLPFMLWQFQLKYRDEARARGGLVRVREFTMKDAYSFHATPEDLDSYYQRVHEAYVRIFRRVGIEPVIVQSDTGIMGGKLAHEFMLETPHGEDYLILCRHCGYQANAEIARFQREAAPATAQPLERVATPTQQTIEEVSSFLGVKPSQTMKAVFYSADGKLVLVLVRGDLEASETKLRNFLKCGELLPAGTDQIEACGMVAGFAGPMGAHDCRILADESVAVAANLVTGANENGWHLKNCNLGRDFTPEVVGDFAQADSGCLCPQCGKTLEATRGIEIGNIFKLGTKFSTSMGATFLDEKGERQPAVMGCYGIGVGRLMASVVEQHHDEWGIRWPKSIAPFQVELVSIGQDAAVVQAAQQLHDQLVASKIEVLWDERDERPGVKFKDADLWGAPLRIAIGAKALAQGGVEWKPRDQKEATIAPLDSVVAKVREFLA
jgi:prolyl-tRNA synthetase